MTSSSSISIYEEFVLLKLEDSKTNLSFYYKKPHQSKSIGKVIPVKIAGRCTRPTLLQK